MTKNNNLKNLMDNDFFIDLCKSINVGYTFFDGELYIFNKNYSFIVCDLNQDYELDFIFFDRNRMCFSQSIYSVIDFTADIDCNEIIKSNIHLINNEVNFESLHISNEQKKESLVLFLSFLRLSGKKLFDDGIKEDRVFTKAISSVVKRWESAMAF